MKILVIHHLESIWEDGYFGYGHTFEGLCEQFNEFLNNEDFDRVLLTRFEETTLEDQHFYSGLAEHIDYVHDYAYGWDAECAKDYPDMYCEGGTHSECVLIDDWMRELKGHDVSISGAFDGECVEDLEIALNHLDIDFKRVEQLII